MAIVRKNEMKKMTTKETEAKIADLQRTLLELEGEGKHEKKKPVKKAIAKLLTKLSMEKGKALNTGSVPKNTTTKVN